MVLHRFCYEIAAEAGLAIDEDGQASRSYSELSFENDQDMNRIRYKKMHEKLKSVVAEQFGIDEIHIQPISRERFDEITKEDFDE